MADSPEEVKPKEKSSKTAQKVLFVRNLPFTTTDTDLENVFSEVGPVKRCFVIRNKGERGLCRGFGYVTFALSEDAEKAKDTVKTYGGRQINICFADKKPRHEKRKLKQKEETDNDDEKRHSDAEDGNEKEKQTDETELPKKKSKEMWSEETEPPKKKSKEIEHDEESKTKRKEAESDVGRTVVMTGVSADLNQNHIRKKCRKIGTIEKVTFPVAGREEPTAFVVFKDYKDSREAVKKLNGKIFKGNTINVSLLSREGKTPSQKTLKKSRVIVRNLAFKCKEEELKKSFSKFGDITEVCIPTKMNGKRKQSLGFGFVQFSNVFEAAKAIEELNMKEIAGRRVAVDWAVPKTAYEKTKDSTGNTEKGKIKAEEEMDEEQTDNKMDNEEENSANESDVESDHEDSEEEQESENDSEADEEEQKKATQTNKPKRPSDVKEGKTLFIRNLSFDSSEESLHELFERFGELEYCKVLEDRRTGRSRGMAFVKFKTVESADTCLTETSKQGSGLSLDNFNLNISMAVTPGKAAELAKEKKTEGFKEAKDKRNLYLAKEGLILPGSPAAHGLSKADLLKRQKAETEKKAKLDNPNIFVSPTRLCVRNLPLKVNDKQLKEIFSTATGKRAHVHKVLIMRSKDRVDSSGVGRSMGYGFVEFANHKDALAALRATNNNPALFGADRRPMVEFSLENSLVLKNKQRRVQKGYSKQQNVPSEHAREDQPKTNKEKRIEKTLKHREKRKRQRQEKREAKLEQGNENDGVKTAKDANEFNRTKLNGKEMRKGKKGQFIPKPRGKERSHGEKFAPVRGNKTKLVAKVAAEDKARPSDKKTLKVHKTAKECQNVSVAPGEKHTEKLSAANRKRKGVRRKEQEHKDESHFTEMVAKYKNKFFGDDESASKRSRWFE